MSETRPFIGFDDLDTPLEFKSSNEPLDLKKVAHIANGGDALFPCPRCKGSGVFRGYARTFRCKKCTGTGNVSKGVAAAAKGKATKEANRLAWIETHRLEVDYMRRRAERSSFYARMIEGLEAYGSLTDNQLAVIHRDLAADVVKREEWRAERNAKGGAVDVSGITALFATAVSNDIKRPIFRAGGIEISKASDRGANAGALYVKSNEGVYFGKIKDGVFHASREAQADTLATLQAVATDPTAEAIKYARRTSRCGCCGKMLVDPISIRAGIGPTCAEKWGLDYRRELAAEELSTERAAEVQLVPVVTTPASGKYDHLYTPGMSAREKQLTRARARREAK